MWGFANTIDRTLGKKVFTLFTSEDNVQRYNQAGTNTKNNDQLFLALQVRQLVARGAATVHDAYSCGSYPDSKPFPTRRPVDKFCFVACFFPCCDVKHNQTARMRTCKTHKLF